MQLETAECGGWSLLPAARRFLPSLESGDVRFHVHRQTSIDFQVFSLPKVSFVAAQTSQGLTETSSSHHPLERRSSGLCLSEPKPVSMPLHLKILLLQSCSFSHPPSQMHADVFAFLPLFPSHRLASCTCDTPSVSADIFENHSS